ncbi:metallophosphoesterase family protein [Natronospora cellulosivora (SeqCode)]
MQKIKFLHTADLHLGSTMNFGGKYHDVVADVFDNAIYNSLINMVDLAIEENVNFILISGDLYDQECRSVNANVFFNKQCQRLANHGISIYMIAGNHDPLNKYKQLFDLPENVFLFDCDNPDLKEVYLNGELIAAISGCSYSNRAESRKMYQNYQTKPGVWNIALLHTQLEANNNNYVPVNLQELLAMEELNYWALGHIHKNSILHNSINQAVVYPGIPQGRDMGEQGIKGFYMVELIPDMQAVIKFIPSSSIVYQQIEIPIDSIRDGNISDLQNLITDISSELLNNNFYLENVNDVKIEGYVVEWVLIGRGNISTLLKDQEEELIPHLIDYLQDKLLKNKPFIWTKSIINRTAPLINEEKLFNSVVFQDINKITSLLKDNDTLRAELLDELGLIWTDDFDHEEVDYLKFNLDEEKFRSILEQARHCIIEQLLQRRDLS